jgi:hypothetical protein
LVGLKQEKCPQGDSVMETPRDVQMLFAVVAHLDEGLSLETLLTLKLVKSLIYLAGT